MWGKILRSVSCALDINAATLSGSIDIVVVPQEDGTLKSTPFHVRFGKAKLLRSREKMVEVRVNGELIPSAAMKLGAAGEAFFVEETAEIPDPDELVTGAHFWEDNNSPRSAPSAMDPMETCDSEHKLLPSTVQWNTAAQQFSEPTPNIADSYDMNLPERRQQNGESMDSQEKLKAEEASLNTSLRQHIEARVEFSLCGHTLTGESQDCEAFEDNLLAWKDLDADPTLWYHPSLVARFDRMPPLYPGKIALPLLCSWVAFDRPLSYSALTGLFSINVSAKKSADAVDHPLPPDGAHFVDSSMQTSTDSRGRKYQEKGDTCRCDELLLITGTHVDGRSDECFNLLRAVKRYRSTLRPTSAQLKAMKLKPGANPVEFTVSSTLQGVKSVLGTVYLWPPNARIIVSDVDGTITRSDIWGQLLPIVGRDWSHDGVAELYSKIRQAGYYILYLTARAIGQADSTREYLFGLTQNEKQELPDGPLILSPERLFLSFKREVIDCEPFVFKIAALRDVRSLFPAATNPFFAGFGNRDTDHRAYLHIGIPESRIFIIDRSSRIHHVNRTYAKTYESMASIAEVMFPPRPDWNQEENWHFDVDEDAQFNAFNYWNASSRMIFSESDVEEPAAERGFTCSSDSREFSFGEEHGGGIEIATDPLME